MKKIKAFLTSETARPFLFCLIAAPLMNLLIESLGRHSLLSGISHMVLNPLIFFYNSLIIFTTLSFAMFFKRRYFFFTLILALWMLLGIINGAVRAFRATPIAAIDFFIIKAGSKFFIGYLTWWQIVLIVLGAAAIIALAVLVWKKAPRAKIKKISAAALVLVSMIVVGTATVVGIETEVLSNNFNDLVSAYENYGFAYCFSCSIIDTGVTEPKNYSKEAVEDVLRKLAPDRSEDAPIKPDIVIVQLESVFDPAHIRGFEASEEYMPNFRALADAYPSGFFEVQSVGGGTANTEFEVLTGMNLDHFGPGEYPYMTVLSSNACESLPNSLRALGYASHAYHNYTGVFYDRHKVYANLGFDTFTPMEYMNGVEFNPREYPTDMCLIPYITDALDSEEAPSFVFAVSVQCHGSYLDERLGCKYDVKVSGIHKELINQTEYYVNQLKEVDDFVGALIAELEKREDPVVAVLYGDHLPPLDIDETMLEGISMYQTEYVIWSNFELPDVDRDLEAYQLSSHLLDLIGYNCGTVTKINQMGEVNENYQDDLRLIEYDMLYGKHYMSGGKPVAEPTNLKIGKYDVKVTGISYDGKTLYVYGENFTKWSHVKIDGRKKETVFVDGNTLAVKDVKLHDKDVVSVVQLASESGALLGKSNGMTFQVK